MTYTVNLRKFEKEINVVLRSNGKLNEFNTGIITGLYAQMISANCALPYVS